MAAQLSFADFVRSTQLDAAPPPGLSRALLAMWHDARGDADTAHALAQEAGGPDGAWVHAYLHRKEGDDGNATYWYEIADRPAGFGAAPAEWEKIVHALLGD